MKVLKCGECRKKVAEIESGSKLRKGIIVLCSDCEKTRVAAKNYLRNINSSPNVGKDFSQLFGNLFK